MLFDAWVGPPGTKNWTSNQWVIKMECIAFNAVFDTLSESEVEKWHGLLLILFWLKYCHWNRFLSRSPLNIFRLTDLRRHVEDIFIYSSIERRILYLLRYSRKKWLQALRRNRRNTAKTKNLIFWPKPSRNIIIIISTDFQESVRMSWNFEFIGFQTRAFILWSQIVFLKFVKCPCYIY